MLGEDAIKLVGNPDTHAPKLNDVHNIDAYVSSCFEMQTYLTGLFEQESFIVTQEEVYRKWFDIISQHFPEQIHNHLLEQLRNVISKKNNTISLLPEELSIAKSNVAIFLSSSSITGQLPSDLICSKNYIKSINATIPLSSEKRNAARYGAIKKMLLEVLQDFQESGEEVNDFFNITPPMGASEENDGQRLLWQTASIEYECIVLDDENNTRGVKEFSILQQTHSLLIIDSGPNPLQPEVYFLSKQEKHFTNLYLTNGFIDKKLWEAFLEKRRQNIVDKVNASDRNESLGIGGRNIVIEDNNNYNFEKIIRRIMGNKNLRGLLPINLLAISPKRNMLWPHAVEMFICKFIALSTGNVNASNKDLLELDKIKIIYLIGNDILVVLPDWFSENIPLNIPQDRDRIAMYIRAEDTERKITECFKNLNLISVESLGVDI